VALIRLTISAGSRRRNGGTGIGSGIRAPVSTAAGLTSEGVEPPGRGYSRSRRLPEVDTFTLVFVLRSEHGCNDATVDAIEELLGQYAVDLRVWRDDADPTVVRGSIDCTATDLEGALARGLEVADDVVAAGPPDIAVEEVSAMDDDQQLVWRATP